LGTIAKLDEYDVAVSTAGGARFDHIVVDTTDTAKRSVNFLREHSLGTIRADGHASDAI